MRSREFTGTCPICGKRMEKPVWATGEFHDVCAKCFNVRFWDLIKEQVDNGDTFIIDGVAWTPGLKGGKGGKLRRLGSNAVWQFDGNLWCNGSVPEERRAELPDNAEWVRE